MKKGFVAMAAGTQRGRLRWAMLATSALALLAPALPAIAQAPAGIQAQARPFDIAAQPLATAIDAFGRQSGLQVTAEANVAIAVEARAVRGTLSPAQALDQLLAGTGVTWRLVDGDTVVLAKAAQTSDGAYQMDPLRVQGASGASGGLPAAYTGGQVATGGQLGLLGNVDVMDTPFNVTRFTSDLIANQNSRGVLDVLDNDPSVRASGQRDGETTTVMIRGFETLSREIMINGMYGPSDTRGQMIENVERVEIHKGPSAMLNGVSPWGSSRGGSINYILKRAGDEPLTRVTATFDSASQIGGHVDAGRRFGDAGQFGVRLNAVHREGDTDVDHTDNRSDLVSLALDYRGEKLRLTGDFSHQDRRLQGGWASTRISSSVPVPKAPDASINSKQQWEFFDGTNDYGILRAEYDFMPGWTAAAAYSRNISDEVYLLVIDSISNVNGNKTGTPYWIPARSKNEAGEVSVKGNFDTGGINHSFSAIWNANGGERGQLNWSVPGCGNNCAPSNIYNPIYRAAPDISSLNRDGVRMTTDLNYAGYAVADIMKLWGDNVVVMAGAREQRTATKVYNYNTGAVTSTYHRKRISPSGGLVVKPLPNLSIYGSYIESLNPGMTISTYYANAGEVLNPYVTDQYEAGVKYDLGGFTATASLFTVSVPSTVEVAGTGGAAPRLQLDGEERHRGLEVNLFGQVTDDIRLLGGVMWLDAEMVRTEGGTNDGKRARGAPEFNLNLGTEWDVPMLPGLTLTARALYTSREYIDLTNTKARSIPSWTRIDAGARYQFEVDGRPARFNLTVDNLFDRNYWAAASRGVLTMGAPRSIRTSLSMDF